MVGNLSDATELADRFDEIVIKVTHQEGRVHLTLKERIDHSDPDDVPDGAVRVTRYPVTFALRVGSGKITEDSPLGFGSCYVDGEHQRDYAQHLLGQLRGQIGLRARRFLELEREVTFYAPELGFESAEILTREMLQERLPPAPYFDVVRDEEP